MSDLKKALDELTAALEAKPDLTYGGLIQTQDEMYTADKFLSGPSKYMLSLRCQSQIIKTDDETYICQYLAKLCKIDDIPFGVRDLALIVNKLVERNLVYKTLTPIQSIKLASMPKHHDPAAVTCFVLSPVSRLEEFKAISSDVWQDENGFPCMPKGADLYKELPPGQFYAANVAQTLCSTLIHEFGREPGAFLERTLAEYLAVLPKGTTVVSTRVCDIVSISKPYEIIFYNENLPSIKEVELHYYRHAELIGGPVDGRIKQTNLLSHVTYTTRDGQKIGA